MRTKRFQKDLNQYECIALAKSIDLLMAEIVFRRVRKMNAAEALLRRLARAEEADKLGKCDAAVHMFDDNVDGARREHPKLDVTS